MTSAPRVEAWQVARVLTFTLLAIGIGWMVLSPLRPSDPESGGDVWVIELAREHELRDGHEAAGGLSLPNDLAVDSRHRYYTASGYAPGTIQVLDVAGQPVRTLGGEGQGPGEFQSASALLVGEGDTLHVFDARAGTHTVFSPEYEVLGRATVQAGVRRNRIAELGSDRFVLSADIFTPDRIGRPMHLLEEGALGPSLGDPAPLQPDGRPEPFTTARVLAPHPDGGFVSAHVWDYVIERWSSDGERLSRLAVQAPWFHKEDRSTPRGRFNPAIRAVWVDGEGRPWVLGSVRSEAFDELAEVVGHMPGVQGDIPIVQSTTGVQEDLERYVLEVIDPDTGRPLATAGVPVPPLGFLPDGRIWTSEEDASGGSIGIWRAHLRQGRQ